MKRQIKRDRIRNQLSAGAALVLAAVASVYADEGPAAAPASEPGAVGSFFNLKIPEAIAKGKFNLNTRLRYEFVDQSSLPEDSHAPTIRTRFGFTSAPVYGFQGMIEAENITAIGGDQNYNAAGSNGEPGRPVVADPPTTEMNQAWISYSYTNLATAKLGRQRLVFDNARFVGDVGWRQNMQTFDAMTVEGRPLDDLKLLYGYLWGVNRVFGDVSGLAPGFRDFDSDSHVVNASYTACDYARFTSYTYLLDLENGGGTGNSCATYGGYLTGTAPVSDKVKLNYRGEFAWQTEYADSTLDYSTEYYNFELSADIKPVVFGAGYELLGSDNGVGFKTPLATLHAFNGWADVFLNTPAAGLQDIYAFAQVTLPANIPLRIVYHKFDADAGSGDFGYEIDVVASKKFGKYWTALLKYAYYDGKDAPAAFDVHKFWAQVEFNF